MQKLIRNDFRNSNVIDRTISEYQKKEKKKVSTVTLLRASQKINTKVEKETKFVIIFEIFVTDDCAFVLWLELKEKKNE